MTEALRFGPSWALFAVLFWTAFPLTCDSLVVSHLQSRMVSRGRGCWARTNQTRLGLFLNGRILPSKLTNRTQREERGPRNLLRRAKREEDYEERRKIWLERYGSLEALQRTFGKGDGRGLTPQETRKLYHTLLPRSLLGLHEMGLMNPEELAPLAYEARIAAKEYARSRCDWTGQVMTYFVDRYRTVIEGSGQPSSSRSYSMTWEEVWQKYEAQIVEEECSTELTGKQRKRSNDELTMRIYLRILEKSCATNPAFDRLFLDEGESNEDEPLATMASQLDHDVRAILLNPRQNKKATKQAEKQQKRQRKAEQKEEKKQLKLERRRQKAERKQARMQRKIAQKEAKKRQNRDDEPPTEISEELAATSTVPSNHLRWEVLRILAGTRRKFRQKQNK